MHVYKWVSAMKYDGLTGKVITPRDPEYQTARLEYNKAVNDYPAAIVYCLETQDVINAVQWARRNHVPLRIRSGGHSYEGYSTGTGVLVIDTTPTGGSPPLEGSTSWAPG